LSPTILHSRHRQPHEPILRLETQGHWAQAFAQLRTSLREGQCPAGADDLHLLGRLLQRLGAVDQARRAYLRALQYDRRRPSTFNNLALLELGRLDAQQAEVWLREGLSLPDLTDDQADLLHATACDLYLYRLSPHRALHHVEQQLRRRQSVIALANRAVCHHKLAQFEQAVTSQLQAIQLQLQQQAPSLLARPIPQLVDQGLSDPGQSAQLQVQLMNLGIYRLLVTPDDPEGLQLLLAGTANDTAYWLDPRRRSTRWHGQPVDQLILWDDQGYGDSIQNLGWIDEVASRTKRLRLWLRPALHRLVQQRCRLPAHVTIERMTAEAQPWAEGTPQLGLFFLPMVLGRWPRQGDPPRPPWLQRHRLLGAKSPRKLGLVWSAGRHSAPQPERGARVRDVPFEQLWDHALRWQQRHGLELLSLQLDGHAQPAVAHQIERQRLCQALSSPDWLATAECLEQLDLLVAVDTSVAHLAGALGVPCVLLLSAPADWRWGQVGETTPLYSTFHLARCAARDAWHTALEQADHQVASILAAGQP
jgi:tetratricopeptide (TPR) repeat protein